MVLKTIRQSLKQFYKGDKVYVKHKGHCIEFFIYNGFREKRSIFILNKYLEYFLCLFKKCDIIILDTDQYKLEDNFIIPLDKYDIIIPIFNHDSTVHFTNDTLKDGKRCIRFYSEYSSESMTIFACNIR